MKKELYGVYSQDNAGNNYDQPTKIFSNYSDALDYAKCQKGKIAWGIPDIYYIEEKIIYKKIKKI